VKNREDNLRYFIAGKTKFVVATRGAIILMCVANTDEPPGYLAMQLDYFYGQIISIVTGGVHKAFERSSKFDLRGLLSGAEKIMQSLIGQMSTDMSFLLNAYQCLRLPSKDRLGVAKILKDCRPDDSQMPFAMIVSKNKLLTLLRNKKFDLSPHDLLLIFNFVHSSGSFVTSESWTPVCLPRFNNQGFLYAYICYLAPELCLILITPAPTEFDMLRECKQKIEKVLVSHGLLEDLARRVQSEFHFQVAECGIPDLYHFVYVNKTHQQFVMPAFESPYITVRSKKRLFRLYQNIHAQMHRPGVHLKNYFYSGSSEVICVATSKDYELHAAFSPLITKSLAFTAFNRLRQWIKREDDNLFMGEATIFKT